MPILSLQLIFAKCIHQGNYHQFKIQTISVAQKAPLCPFAMNPHLYPSNYQSAFCHYRLFSFLKFRLRGNMQCTLLSVFLFSASHFWISSMLCVEFFLFSAEWYSIIGMHHNLCISSPLDGHLLFQYLITVNETVDYIHFTSLRVDIRFYFSRVR